MKLNIKKGTTDVTVYAYITDTSGAVKTGLAYNTASLKASYVRLRGSATAITLATQTVTGAHADGGFVEVSASDAPGIYRLDLPDAVAATGVDSVIVQLFGASDMAPCPLEIQLVSFDPNDAVRLGLTALPNAAAGANGGLPTGNASGQVTVAGYASGQVPLQPTVAGRTLDVSATGEAGIDWANVGSPTTTQNLSGTTVAAVTAGVTVTTNNDKTGYGLTSGERTAIANEVEAQIIDDTDSEKVLQAITDKIAAVNPSLEDLTLAAIASAVRTELATELARIDADISSRLASGSYTAPDNTSILDIKNKTNSLTFTVAGTVDANMTNMGGGVTAVTNLDRWMRSLLTGTASGGTTTTLVSAQLTQASDYFTNRCYVVFRSGSNANLSAAITGFDAATKTATLYPALPNAVANNDAWIIVPMPLLKDILDAINGKTVNLPAAPAATGDIPTASGNAEALLSLADGVESGWTLRGALRIMLSVLAGKASGLGTETARFRDMADTKDRVVATVDENGNRTAVTRDAT